ncbi:MAG: GNAT family N-acetyltransferase [Oscillospiraceae bacterium]|nr:GNAT family N-acetyltransferase [Oscillospiraceae bacterium]
MGFKEVGRFRKCGYKFNRWYDMIWMEKIIGEHEGRPGRVERYDFSR